MVFLHECRDLDGRGIHLRPGQHVGHLHAAQANADHGRPRAGAALRQEVIGIVVAVVILPVSRGILRLEPLVHQQMYVLLHGFPAHPHLWDSIDRSVRLFDTGGRGTPADYPR